MKRKHVENKVNKMYDVYILSYHERLVRVDIVEYENAIFIDVSAHNQQFKIRYRLGKTSGLENVEISVLGACFTSWENGVINDFLSLVEHILRYGILIAEEHSEN